MATLALIGFPLTHSFSKKYFEEKFSQLGLLNWKYELWPMESLSGLNELLLKHKDLKGFNITIPHKINIIPFCDDLSEEAEEIGAVNCVKLNWQDGEMQLKGFNTDAYGSERSLIGWYTSRINKALVFGDGGAAKAILYILNKLNIAYTQIVRTVESDEQLQWDEMNIELFTECDLFINCTPIGMFPNNNSLPIHSDWIKPHHYFYDLVYNPEVTATMNLFNRRGAFVKNGLEMLHLQADKAWEIWNSPQGLI